MYSPKVQALQAKYDEALRAAFGTPLGDAYGRFHRTIDWAEQIPSLGVERSLDEYRADVAKGKEEVLALLGAAIDLIEEQSVQRVVEQPARQA